MKKLGLYSVLVSALLFTTGCSEKNADVNDVVAPDNSSVEEIGRASCRERV